MIMHVIGILAALVIISALVAGAVFCGAAIYKSAIAIGLALALEKYPESVKR